MYAYIVSMDLSFCLSCEIDTFDVPKSEEIICGGSDGLYIFTYFCSVCKEATQGSDQSSEFFVCLPVFFYPTNTRCY